MQDQKIRAGVLCEFGFWVVISETEDCRGYSIEVTCKIFLHHKANISFFLEEVVLRNENLAFWTRMMLAISLKRPTKIQVISITNDVSCTVNICLLGAGLRPHLFTLELLKSHQYGRTIFVLCPNQSGFESVV